MALPVAGALGAAQLGSSIFGGLFGGGGPPLGPNDVMKLLKQGYQRTNARYSQGLDELLKGYGILESGYNQAGKEIGRVGESARSDLLAREKQQTAAAQQSAISRGLYGTTAYDSAARGIASDTNRSLGSLNEGLAGLRAGLAKEKGMALYGAKSQIASWYPAWAQAVNADKEKYAKFGVGFEPSDGGAGAFGAGIGALAGSGGFDWLGSLFGSSASSGGSVPPGAF